jgi:hypothetical protein
MSMRVKMTTENLEYLKKDLSHHRKFAEAIACKGADDAKAISTALVKIPNEDSMRRRRIKARVRR